MLRAARKVEDETGVSIDEILVRLIYHQKTKPMEKLAAIKLYKDHTMARRGEGGPADSLPPSDEGLPPLKPDPAKVVPIKPDDDEAG